MSAKYELGPDIDLDEEVVLDKHGRRIDEHRAAEIGEATIQEAMRLPPEPPEPDENTPVKCPTCGHPGYIHTIDQRGVLLTHPGRRWPCRVPPGTEATG